jgi:uncharacterized DUF497 family protein
VKIEGFIWFEEIIQKLERKHHVRREEVREVFASSPKFRFVEKGHHSKENVYAALGQTNAGRRLIVFFVHKKDKSALILSARNMTPAERKKYEQK